MKLILAISTLVIIYSFVNRQVTFNHYYVDSVSGSDANDGLTTGNAWKTLSKVNNFTFSAQDTVSLKCNGVWNEQLIPPSGNLYFNSYSTGNKPLITGFVSATMTNVSGNIWKATIAPAANLNVVSVNGTVAQKGRYPNSGYIQGTSILSTTQIKTPHDAVDRTGKPIAVRDYRYIIDTSRVSQVKTGVTFDTIVLASALSNGVSLPYYFFQGDSSFVDSTNEWGYNPTTNIITVYANSIPSVQYSTIDTLVKIHKKSSVTFENISFTGANKIALSADSLRYGTITNCSFNNNSSTISLLSTNGFEIRNDSIQNSLNIGYHSDPDTSLSVYYNYIYNVGKFAGMGGTSYASYTGGYSNGKYAHIIGNVIKNCGYNGLRFEGQFDTIAYNHLDTACFINDDGALIYTFVGNGSQTVDSGSLVTYNFMNHSIGAPLGGSAGYGNGLYFDDGTSWVTATYNTVSNCSNYDFFIKGVYNIFRNNVLYDSLAACIYSQAGFNNPNHFTFKNNTYFNKNASSYIYGLIGVKDSSETLDSNHYLMPVATQRALLANSVYSGLTAWRAYYPTYDVHSDSTLPASLSSNNPTLYVNTSLQDSTILFTPNQVDRLNNLYRGGVKLHPFESIFLWPTTLNPNYSPAIFTRTIKIQ